VGSKKPRTTSVRSERVQHVQRVEDAITALHRIVNGRDAEKVRMQRSGVLVSRPRMTLLRALYERGPMRVVDLGAINHMDKGYASRTWRALQAEGYLEVVAGDDRRSTTVAITERGRDTYLRWRDANTAIVADVLDGWRDDELEVLTDVLERLVRSSRAVPVPQVGDRAVRDDCNG
jgi:DNA-binding MarR family transcriptional regulator